MLSLHLPFLVAVFAGVDAVDKPIPATAVPFTDVTVRDGFWAPRIETNRKATVEHSLAMLERAGNYRNLTLAIDGKHEGYEGLLFTDSDLYKVIEGIAYTLATRRDPNVEARVDEIIDAIARAQRPNGYINTYYQVNAPDKVFTNLRDMHELYCGGHLIEAGVAYYEATGKRKLLDVAIRFADLLYQTFGPNKREGYCGHPEIELALFRLWRATGNDRYRDLSKHFLDTRGSKFFAREHGVSADAYDGTYWLDDCPLREHREIKGHAVRAAYLMSGAADLAATVDDEPLQQMLLRVWRNTVERRIFITGGIGPSAHNEGFTVDYDLPNETAYQETCASIALVLWAHRMNLLFGDAKYVDAMEQALYNGVLSGVSLDGKSFFYVNPLASSGSHRRSDWFQCACCPPNVLRTLASVGGYAYSTGPDRLNVNLYIGGSAKAKVGSEEIRFDVKTDYPWNGEVQLKVEPEAASRFKLNLRIPSWCERWTVSVNGVIEKPPLRLGYAEIEREWKAGDTVSLHLQFEPERVVAHPAVQSNRGLAAIRCGPIVYCVEGNDNDFDLKSLVLPPQSALKQNYRADLLGGVAVVEGEGWLYPTKNWLTNLYLPLGEPRRVMVRAIPYAAWANREPSPMAVWLPLSRLSERVQGLEAEAKVTVSFANSNSFPRGVNDGVEPTSSADSRSAICHFWPHRGTEEWIQYDWSDPRRLLGVAVYWFDDTGTGECRVPESWTVEYLESGTWREVEGARFDIRKDGWCETNFRPVETTSLRLKVKMKSEWAAGVLEWRVLPER